MRLTNKHVIYIFILSILVPTGILSFLSIRSITQEVVLIEKKEADRLKEFELTTKSAVDNYLNTTFKSTAQMAMTVYDIIPNPAQSPENYSLKSLPEINGLFLYYKNKLIYPNLGFIYSEQEPSYLAELDLFEKKWATPPLDKFGQITLLKKRLQRSKSTTLSPFLQKFNYVEIIKIYALMGNYRATIDYCKKLLSFQPIEGLYSHDITPWLWLTEFKAYIALGHYTNAIQLTKEIINHYFNNPTHYNINQIKFLQSEIFNTLLSYENLSVKNRDFLWNIKINWELHTKHSYQYIANQEVLNGLLASPASANTYSDSAQIFIKLTEPYFTSNQALVASFHRQDLLDAIIYAIPSALKSKSSFAITYDGSEVLKQNIHTDVEFHKDVILTPLLPKLRLQVFKTEESRLISIANRKKIFLYSLLATSIITLTVGSAVIVRGIRQEKKLLYMKTNFVSSISHELKTPITSIKMLSETLKTGRITEGKKVIEYSSLIEKESNRLQSLIDDILQYSKWEQAPQSFTTTTVNLSKLSQDAILSFESQRAAQGVIFLVAISENLCVEGNEKSLLSAIQNLIDNAIKYSPSGGAVKITLDKHDNEIRYQVSDNGLGIPKNEQHKIFTDFYRVGNEMTRTTKGSGLGLAITQRVVEAHNARITLESKSGAGSTFTIYFKQSPSNQST